MVRAQSLGTKIAFIGLCLLPCSGRAETSAPSLVVGKDGPAILDEGQRQDKATEQTVEACWSAWLTKEGLTEGKNDRGVDSVLVQKGMEFVAAEPMTAQWLAARNVAFQRAEIQARQAMSGPVATLIRSDRSITDRNFGGDSAPAELQKVAKSMSIADKVDVLTDAALDAEIKKFKPGWNGVDVDVAQKRELLAKTIGIFRENIAASSALYVSGAFTPVQCEGLNQDGKYTVLVGMIWSPKLGNCSGPSGIGVRPGTVSGRLRWPGGQICG